MFNSIVCFSPFPLTLQKSPNLENRPIARPMNKGDPKEPRAWLDGVVMCLPVYTCCAEHPLTCTAGTDRQSHDNPAWMTTSHWEKAALTPCSISTTSYNQNEGRGGPGLSSVGWILNSYVLLLFLFFYFDSNFETHQK